MQIKIGNLNFEIKFVEDLQYNNHDVQGLMLPDKQVLYIDKNYSPERQFETLIHEIVHAIIHRCNLEKCFKKHALEEFVELFGLWLTLFLIDNNIYEILREIKEGNR